MSSTDYSPAHNRSRAPEYGATPQTDTANEARGAVKGHGVNVVLVVSTTAVIVAFAVIYIYFFSLNLSEAAGG